MKKTPNYNDKIRTISSYFGISNDASKYMFHRRRRGFPWKKDDEVGYLKWSIQLQNAFIKADNIDVFDWSALKFNNDIQILMENGIIVEDQPKTIQANRRKLDTDIKEEYDDDDNDGGGWTVVTKNKTHLQQKYLLKNMGFLPKNKKIL